MNKYTLIDEIVKEYGSRKSDKLRAKLHQLISEPKTTNKQFSIPLKVMNDMTIVNKSDVDMNIVINKINNSYYSDYEKSLRIVEAIKTHNQPLPVNNVPDELFMTFWNIIENSKSEIFLDDLDENFIYIPPKKDNPEKKDEQED